jgi:hypothetical protein
MNKMPFEGSVRGIQIKCKQCHFNTLISKEISLNMMLEKHWNQEHHFKFEINLVG